MEMIPPEARGYIPSSIDRGISLTEVARGYLLPPHQQQQQQQQQQQEDSRVNKRAAEMRNKDSIGLYPLHGVYAIAIGLCNYDSDPFTFNQINTSTIIMCLAVSCPCRDN
jgi:hypothetical protein